MTTRDYEELLRLPHDVYWLYDAEGRVLYIGCSYSLEERLRQHAKLKEWWPRVARVEVEGHPDMTTARLAEDAAIYAERPIFNKRVKVPPTPSPPIIRRDEPLRAVESGAS